MKINMNDNVKVRITEYGRECLMKNAVEIRQAFSTYEPLQKIEDEEGWSEWQLWRLMDEFGKYLHCGNKIPFETTIIIDE